MYKVISSQQDSLTTLAEEIGWLCWGLTSQSTIFQSCRDGAIASWVINQYFRGVKCLAQGHNTAAVGLEPRTSRSGVRHSTTEPPRSPWPRRAIIGENILSLGYYLLHRNHRMTHPQPYNMSTHMGFHFILCIKWPRSIGYWKMIKTNMLLIFIIPHLKFPYKIPTDKRVTFFDIE